MEQWINFVQNPEALRALYSDYIPSLDPIDLHEVTFHRDGPRVIFRFNLSTYPATPPNEWKSQGFNTVQVQLMATGISRVSFSGWETECSVALELSGSRNSFRLRSTRGPVKIDLQGLGIAIQKVSAYRRKLDSE